MTQFLRVHPVGRLWRVFRADVGLLSSLIDLDSLEGDSVEFPDPVLLVLEEELSPRKIKVVRRRGSPNLPLRCQQIGIKDFDLSPQELEGWCVEGDGLWHATWIQKFKLPFKALRVTTMCKKRVHVPLGTIRCAPTCLCCKERLTERKRLTAEYAEAMQGEGS